MESTTAITALGALAQETRLEVFRLLVRHEPGGLPAGEIARRLDVPQNTMSSHLAILTNAGLAQSRREGRSIIYRADLTAMDALMAYLLENCCAGEACLPAADARERICS